MPIPERIQNAPVLQMGLVMYWDAFMDLSSCRQVGMGTGPIPWSSIRDYALAWGMDEDQSERLIDMIRAMDNAFLAWQDKRVKRESKRGR